MIEPVDGFQQKHVSYSTVTTKDLPFHCPPKDAQKWNMHPKVYIQFDKGGKGACPYCSSSYELG
ncbi:hypothetical protein CRYPA_1184 [uncultured Candidatus Thioglobus sp.]|nr:hypothetical protein CRYPA_1184 [uncultured Candidatus Thioglobus sp.]